MKINLKNFKSYENIGSKKVEAGKKKYLESNFEKRIAEMEIKDNGFEFEVYMKYFDHSDAGNNVFNNVEVIIDKRGRIRSTDCDCCNHIGGIGCAHVYMLAIYLSENDFEYPYEYKRENSDNLEKFAEHFLIDMQMMRAEKEPDVLIADFAENTIQKSRRMSTEGKIGLKAELYEKEYEKNPCSNHIILRYRIGEDKKYIVKNLKGNLLRPIRNGEIVSFGKNLKLQMVESVFTPDGKKQLDFIRKYSDLILEDKISIGEESIDGFFDYYSEAGEIENLFFKSTDFRLKIGYRKNKEKYQLTISEEYPEGYSAVLEYPENAFDGDELFFNSVYTPFLITQKRFYLFNYKERTLYYMDVKEEEAMLYNAIKRRPMIFSREKISEFINIFRGLVENIEIDDDLIKLANDIEPAKPELYCDVDENLNFTIRLKYKGSKSSYYMLCVSRQLELAKVPDVENLLESSNEEFEKGIEKVFVLTDEKNIDAMIEDVLPELRKFGEVYISEAIKNFERKKYVNLNVGVKFKSNLLEVSLKSDNFSKEEISGILDSYRRKKKYYRLKSGEIVKPDTEELQEIDAFVTEMDISDKELKKGKKKAPLYRIYQLSSESYLDVQKDQEFLDFVEKPDAEPDERLGEILREYQKEGSRFLLNLRERNLGGLLADDMGLGKTLQVISMLESIEGEREKPCLIVAPASLMFNWEKEFKKFDSPLKIKSIYGEKADRINMISEIKDEIVITTYDYLKRDVQAYNKLEFDTVIIDEAQYIKNWKTKAARSVKSINREHSLALTGTPIENSLAEIWSIFDFLMPGYLFTYRYFSKNYEKPIVLYGNNIKSDRFKRMLQPFVLRRLKEDVLDELPDKIETTRYVNLSEEEENLYRANFDDMRARLVKRHGAGVSIEILSMLSKLRRLCIDSRLVYENVKNTGSKISAACDIIERVVMKGEQVLLFSSFTSVLDIIEKEMVLRGIDYYMLTGSTPKKKRAATVESFQKGNRPVFLISLKAGGTGLNLTAASVVIHIDPWWNISVQNQATDRAYRIGQSEKVQVINLIAKGTIEEKIQEMQQKKKALSDKFVENSKGGFANLDFNEIMELFSEEKESK